jgi:uncharacterized transporter YbjL
MSNLLDRFVASPQSAIMLLQDDPGADVIKVTITSKEAGTRIKDMKLPDDIQVLSNPNLNLKPNPNPNPNPNPSPSPSPKPDDIQVLTIQRGQIPIVPHGHTKLQDADEVMICGRPNSLSNVTAMKKGKVVLVLQPGRRFSIMPPGRKLS